MGRFSVNSAHGALDAYARARTFGARRDVSREFFSAARRHLHHCGDGLLPRRAIISWSLKVVALASCMAAVGCGGDTPKSRVDAGIDNTGMDGSVKGPLDGL